MSDKADVTLSAEVPASASPQALARKQKALGAIHKLPPFSPVLNKLLASLAGEDVSFSQLGDLIEKDTVLAGNVLRLVNSALYARRHEISSVRHALSVLGVDKLRNTVLAMSISRTLKQAVTPQAWSMQRFNEHSVAVALLSDQIAQHASVQYPEGAFVAGLFHDMGRLLIAMGLPDDFRRVHAAYQNGGHSWLECEVEALGFPHAALSAEALEVWKLPSPVVAAVGEHHDSLVAEPGQPPVASGEPIPLGFALFVANHYVNSLGESVHADAREQESDACWIESLGLTPETRERMLAAFGAELSAIAQFYR